MPFIANTPESLIERSDSKNPSTTCRGITAGGRPCRRPVSTPGSTSSFGARPRLARLRVDDPSNEDLYCWQHKEQASHSARSSPGPRTSTTPILEERTSLDTLADRLGLLEVSTRGSRKAHTNSGAHDLGSMKESSGNGRDYLPEKTSRPRSDKELLFCCFRIPIEEATPAPRPKSRPRPHLKSASAPVMPTPSKNIPRQGSPSLPPKSRPTLASPSRSPDERMRKSSVLPTSSQTAQYLSLIPPAASPQMASQLMAELAKPLSQLDEPGYIYMFWLTPESEPTKPPTEAARSLLAPPATVRPGPDRRRPSDVLASFAAAADKQRPTSGRPGGRPDGPGTKEHSILLKIGRATNVQRRLNEWTRQCGYNLSLIRYYPYVPSGSSGLVTVPRKVPHSHKVERLIHIELAGLGLRVADRGRCVACGRDHREWFEVQATRQGIMEVDETIRRWVDWDEGNTT